MTIDFEVHQTAEDLYVLAGRTLDQVAAETELPANTVKRWSAEEGWVEKRKEYRKAQSEIRRRKVLYRLELLKEGMSSLHPQSAFAWATVERAAVDNAIEGGPKEEPPLVDVKTPEEAVDALWIAIKRKLSTLLSDPEAVNLKAIKEMKDSFELIEELKSRYSDGPEEDRKRGLSDDTVEEIKRRVLGIS